MFHATNFRQGPDRGAGHKERLSPGQEKDRFFAGKRTPV